MREKSSRTFYLPKGIWYDFFSKESLDGGQWISRDYPIDRIPIWLKGGSVIPFGPVVQSTDELADDTPLELVILLDRDKQASSIFNLNKKSAYTIKADYRDGKVQVRVDNGLSVKNVQVFWQAGKIAEDEIILCTDLSKDAEK